MRDFDFPETLPGLDAAAGIHRIGGNRDRYARLLHKFSKNNEPTLAAIDRALSSNDFITAHRLAHTLAGVAGNIGADNLRLAAGRLEAAIRENKPAEWKIILPEVNKALAEVLSSIKSIARKMMSKDDNRNQPASVDLKKVPALLSELKEAIKENNAQSMSIFAALKEIIGGSGFSAELDSLEHCLDDYDFDGALESLGELIAALETKTE